MAVVTEVIGPLQEFADGFVAHLTRMAVLTRLWILEWAEERGWQLPDYTKIIRVPRITINGKPVLRQGDSKKHK